ncbi:MAG: uL15 family ribosomal protein, partial [Clostridia bacterium]|nr:uL15 family ribosomal protein [Clostridia bacterium]
GLITVTVVGQTNAGAYKTGASYTLTDSANYTVSGAIAELDWSIAKVVINLDELTWSDLEFTYDGTEKKPTLNVPAKYEGLITVTVVGQTNAGAYKTGASYTLTDGANYTVSGTIAELDWSIAKVVIDLSGADWIDESFVYNGNAQAPVLNLPTGLPDFVKVAYTYYKDGNEVQSAINAGTYTAKVVISLDLTVAGVEDNYELRLPTEAIPDVTFEIAKADYDMSGITFDGLTVDYNGQLQSVYISGQLPEFITVSYTGNNVKYIGTYTVTASFTVNSENYNDNIDPMTATITINFVAKTEHVFEDDKGIVVQVNSSKVPADNDFVVNNNTHLYTNVTLPDGREGVVIVAYDIYFAKEGTHQPIEDDFKVKIRIPEGYRTGKTLTVVYITADGEVEEIEATVEGDYAVFDTTHFSVYGIVSLGDTIAPTPVKDTDLTWIWIILALIIILLLIVIIILLIKRHKDDDDGEPTDDEPVVAPEGEPEAEEATEEAAEEEPAPAPATEEPAPAEEEPAPVEEEPAPAPAEEEPAPVEEEPAPAPAEEEPAPATEPAPAPAPVVIPLGEPDEDGTRSAIVDGVVVYVRYRSSFESRLIQSDTEIQDYYTIIKNTLLSYKGVKARGSWNFESFNKGRVQCAKINVKGRALLVYLALDPKEYSESKYHFTDASDKPKFESVPMLLKVKSDRSLKYALELIEEMMNKLEIPQGDVPGTDYHMPYETTEELAKRGLVKVILPTGMKLDENSNIVRVDVGELLDGYEAKEKPAPAEEPAPAPVEEEPAPAPVEEEPAPAEEEPAPAPVEEEVAPAPVEEPVHVDAVTADELLTDEEAEAQIEVVHATVKHTGKLVEINVDTICENFEDGETVDIDALKEKRLINKNAGRIKVLARGTMTKSLTVIASKFSLQAVKMITLAGGKAEIED